MYVEFLSFYNYTAEQALSEYAKRFFALVSQMYRVKAKQLLEQYSIFGAAQSGKEGKSVIEQLQKQQRGIEGIIQEVKNYKGIK